MSSLAHRQDERRYVDLTAQAQHDRERFIASHEGGAAVRLFFGPLHDPLRQVDFTLNQSSSYVAPKPQCPGK
jgi:hypothetical protein